MKKYVDKKFPDKYEQWHKEYNGKPYDVDELFGSNDNTLLLERKANILQINRFLNDNDIKVDLKSIKKKLIRKLREYCEDSVLATKEDVIFVDFLTMVACFVRSKHIDAQDNIMKKKMIGNYKQEYRNEEESINKIIMKLSELEIFEGEIKLEDKLPQDVLDLFEYNDNKITKLGSTITCYLGTKILAEFLKNEFQINIEATCSLLSNLLFYHGIMDEDQSVNFRYNLSRNINRIDEEKAKRVKNFISNLYRN